MYKALIPEARFFLASFLAGVILLFFYDGLVVFRKLIPHKKLVMAIEDLLFWGIAGVFTFRIVFNINYGRLRGFFFLAVLLGMLLYHHTLSKAVVGALVGLFKGLGRLIRLIFVNPFTKLIGKGLKKIARRVKMKIDSMKEKRKKKLSELNLKKEQKQLEKEPEKRKIEKKKQEKGGQGAERKKKKKGRA